METHLNWNTRLFSKRYEICQWETVIGTLEKSGWSTNVAGELNGRQFIFGTNRIVKKETKIIDSVSGLTLGTIIYNNWKSKATINYQDKVYSWQFENFWRSKWSISNINGKLVKYQSRALKGKIISFTDDDLIILTGFYIRNRFNERTAHIALRT